MNRVLTGLLTVACCSCGLSAVSGAEAPAKADAKYVQRFLAIFPMVYPAPSLGQYATVERFDQLFLGAALDKNLKDPTDDEGVLAWWLTYYIRALDDMHRATGDVKYLNASLRIVRAAVANTDDKRGVALFTGHIVPAWGSDKYAERGRAVLSVNTGLICAALLDFLLEARQDPAFDAALGDERTIILDTALQALEVHEHKWRTGPERGAGYYVGMGEENSLENKSIPGNRQSAMGWAFWLAYNYTGGTAYRDRGLAVGRYIRDRLVPSPDGSYYWPYRLSHYPVTEVLPRNAIQGEDTAHAGLTMALPFALAADGQLFTKRDMDALAGMVTNGLARLGGGIFMGDVTGNPYSHPGRTRLVTNWLPLGRYNFQITREVVSFFLNYRPNPEPIELASLILLQAGL